jgi:hypothetical protein
LDELRDYRSPYKTEMPLTLDESGKLFRSFRVMKVPTIVLADAEGRITQRIEGLRYQLAGTATASCESLSAPAAATFRCRHTLLKDTKHEKEFLGCDLGCPNVLLCRQSGGRSGQDGRRHT